ncbi:SdpA family antimicrobial peptide system protein [Spirosoma spitsbergense]|uniref:SdpA family antimicrobial peptide system protein n=1 Tax=Spirosoma spitsbergense TaxID=431554 RepID=UPI000364AB1F|nr:SdpA family antimicrobial peptide system protein [Spirosoma spitsbergense]
MKVTRLLFIGVSSLWIFFAFLSLLIYKKENPIRLNYELQQNIRMLFPQGWAFFTKSPRDENMQLYQLSDNRLTLVDGQRQATLANWMGLKRSSRAMSVEYAYLLYNAPTDKWVQCETDPAAFIASHRLTNVVVTNDTPHPYLEGTYYLIKKGIIPWAWAAQRNQPTLPCSILKFTVVCKR